MQITQHREREMEKKTVTIETRQKGEEEKIVSIYVS